MSEWIKLNLGPNLRHTFAESQLRGFGQDLVYVSLKFLLLLLYIYIFLSLFCFFFSVIILHITFSVISIDGHLSSLVACHCTDLYLFNLFVHLANKLSLSLSLTHTFITQKQKFTYNSHGGAVVCNSNFHCRVGVLLFNALFLIYLWEYYDKSYIVKKLDFWYTFLSQTVWVIFNHGGVVLHQSYWIRWNNAK